MCVRLCSVCRDSVSTRSLLGLQCTRFVVWPRITRLSGSAFSRSLPPHLRNVDSPSSANSSQPSSEGVVHLATPPQAYGPPGERRRLPGTATPTPLLVVILSPRPSRRHRGLVQLPATPVPRRLQGHVPVGEPGADAGWPGARHAPAPAADSGEGAVEEDKQVFIAVSHVFEDGATSI